MFDSAEEIRELFTKSDDERDAGLKTPFDIDRHDDIVYGDADRSMQVLDVYRPKQAEDEKLPVIISVHGGGWVYGDKERYQYYCMSLAQRGYAVINFTYRLAPETKFPAPLEDLNLVIGWMLKRGKKYGFDTEHVFAVGDSAGAHILGLYANICTNPEYAEKFSFTVPKNFDFTAIALNCGAYTLEGQGNLLKEVLPDGGSQEEIELYNVYRHITEKFPPVFVMTAVDDFIRDQAPVLVQKLSEKEVPFVYRRYGNKENRLAHVFHLNLKSWDGNMCNDAECDYFREFCD